jgi:hypothetical protein
MLLIVRCFVDRLPISVPSSELGQGQASMLESPLVEANPLFIGPRRLAEPVNQAQRYKRRQNPHEWDTHAHEWDRQVCIWSLPW